MKLASLSTSSAKQGLSTVCDNEHAQGSLSVQSPTIGIASAPAIFQQMMEKPLHGISGVTVYIEVTGTTDEEHLENLNRATPQLRSTPQAREVLIHATISPYLGYLINKDGLHTAVVQKPLPKNVKKLRSFLGLINYYGKFIRDVQPLNHILRRNTPWKWSAECQQAFETLKEKLASSEYTMTQRYPLKLDFTNQLMGEVRFYHIDVFPNGEERLVAYASSTLTETERGYAQIEK